MDEQRDLESLDNAANLPRILLVDDEGDILRSLRRLLRKKFEITTTVLPEEALRHLAEDEYAILLSDQRMPTMEGTELMAKARVVSQDTVRIILTGYADISAAMDAINQAGVYRFLQKPWNDADLLATLCQAADHFELVKENKRLQALTKAQNEQLKAFNKTLKVKVLERTRQVTKLNERLENTFRGSIHVLARLAEMHSPVLGNHTRRVTALALNVGEHMGLSKKELYQVEAASILHDIGKIGMKPSVLKKHGAVLGNALLLQHAAIGADLVRMIPNLEMAASFVRHQHECFDGTGSPDKLMGKDIPLGSRIIAVVDTYDNVFNNRITFGAATPEQTQQYIQKRTPKQFDPDVVSALHLCLLARERDPDHDENELEVGTKDLLSGMVLSRDLLTDQGVLLLSKGTRITPSNRKRLLMLRSTHPTLSLVFVYRPG